MAAMLMSSHAAFAQAASTPDVGGERPSAKPFVFTPVETGAALTLQLGFASTTDPGLAHFDGGALAGAQVVGHWGFFELGMAGDVVATWSSMRTGLNGLGGVDLRLGPTVYAEALFELGEHNYSGVGAQCFFVCNPPGVGGSLPFAGMRLNLNLRRPRHDNSHIEGLGFISLFARHDLETRVVNYTWESYPSNGDAGTQNNATAMLGGNVEFGLAIGGGFDLH